MKNYRKGIQMEGLSDLAKKILGITYRTCFKVEMNYMM